MNAADTANDDDTVDIIITPTIERDYRRRNVFPDMWSGREDKILNSGHFLHKDVTSGYAQELLDDARAQRICADTTRGTMVAYSALGKNLWRGLKDLLEAVTVLDPGEEAVAEWLNGSESPARYKAGESALDQWGAVVEIVEGYHLISVRDEDGVYRTKEGERFSYRFGYATKKSDGRVYALSPWELRDIDGKPRHIRVVK